MSGPFDVARAIVTEAVARLTAWIEQERLVPTGYSPEDAACAALLDHLVMLVAERTGPVGVYVLSQAFAASVQRAGR